MISNELVGTAAHHTRVSSARSRHLSLPKEVSTALMFSVAVRSACCAGAQTRLIPPPKLRSLSLGGDPACMLLFGHVVAIHAWCAQA